MEATQFFVGKRQYFSSLPVNILKVDESYQKPLSNAHVKKITKDFDYMGVGQIHVSKRANGTYWVFDGQHRTAAYRELGITDINAIVYEGLNIEEESKGYVYYNNTMKQTQLQKFKAELVAGVPEALEITRIVDSVGLGVDVDRRGDPIRAVGALRTIYFKYGESDLKRTLKILKEGFGTNKKAYQSYIILGLHKFTNDHKNNNVFDENWLINRFNKFGITELINQTNAFNSMHSGNKKEAVSLAAVKLYNFNKTKDLKL